MISAIGLQEVQSLPRAEVYELPRPEPERTAFSTLISYRRREFKLSVEELADKAQVDIEELLAIEDTPEYRPEPRTVFQLARVLKLPSEQLMILSGNARAKDEQLNKAALKFAARSRAVDLNREQTDALNEFVKVLAERAGENRNR